MMHKKHEIIYTKVWIENDDLTGVKKDRQTNGEKIMNGWQAPTKSLNKISTTREKEGALGTQ